MDYEELVTEDLDVEHYPFKWKDAQRLVIGQGGTPDSFDFWMKVRRTYLELGGEYRARAGHLTE